ncbi:alpha/beta fold hydrolase [Methylobacterium haplocladii]|uniref:Haloacetate dehalogenase n=1 Tax=Methylobacterium haplocladii TaxID=1176176 RepID=A0A512IRB2_9HYPH|nr:alpha/beta hydrolase [Methylobacterium haplocladii]GEP00223.1 haloacetate dehalogenase [Methylobacterium haplocladii]GJD84268.1 Fluoroacetate dehalogenase [Methylobacterium haplocladii]GLS57931.1 haloacetate dehalogenase [Methylobacterium haplocladii]
MAGDDTENLFPGFEALWIDTPAGRWFARAGGSPDAPPLLLLHGFPQTHAMWHRLAPTLAKTHRVICLDLKGYGWSDAPVGTGDHSTYAKRTLGREIVDLMERIGHVRFAMAGHDRGARVAYRVALDAPGRVERLALLDIVPTTIQWQRIAAKPGANPHWPFLAKPAPEPEEAIGRDPDAYYEGLLRDWTSKHDLSSFAPGALYLYRQSWNVPERIHAMCEDYRAGGPEGPDRAADQADLAAGETLAMPVLVLASRDYLDKDKPESALAVWQRTFAPKATGASIAGGHFLAEENPDETLAALMAFLRG